MDKDRVKGQLEDAKGRIKRQAGEWSGNKKMQAEGAAEQMKGKVQNIWGKAKDAGRNAVVRANERSKVDRKKDKHAA